MADSETLRLLDADVPDNDYDSDSEPDIIGVGTKGLGAEDDDDGDVVEALPVTEPPSGTSQTAGRWWRLAVGSVGWPLLLATGALTYFSLPHLVYFVAWMAHILLLLRVFLFAGTKTNVRRKQLVKFVLAVAVLTEMVQVAFQILWAVDDSYYPVGSTAYDVLLLFGIERLTTAGRSVQILLSEPLVIVAALVVLLSGVFSGPDEGQQPRGESEDGSVSSDASINSSSVRTPLITAQDEVYASVQEDLHADVVHQRRISKIRKMSKATLLLVVLSMGFAAVSVPATLTMLYMLVILAIATGVGLSGAFPAHRQPSSASEKATLTIFAMALRYYVMFHLLFVYIYQLNMVYQLFSEDYALLLGVTRFYVPADFLAYPYYILGVSLLALFYFLVMYESFQQREVIHEAAMNVSADSGASSSISTTTRSPLVTALLKNLYKTSYWITIAWSITFPSYITLVHLVWSMIGLLVPRSLFFHYTAGPLFVASVLFVFMQYIFNFQGVSWNEYPEAGLVKFVDPPAFLMVGLQVLFLVSLSGILFVHYWLLKEQRANSGRDNFYDGENATPIAATTTTEAKPLNSTQRVLKRLGYFVFRSMMLEYFYLISLIVVYLCSLESISIFNAIFLFFFVCFMIWKHMAQRYWVALLVYTQFVFMIEFIWQFSFTDHVDSAFADVLGLVDMEGDLWRGFTFYFVILLTASIQYQLNLFLRNEQREASEGLDQRLGVPFPETVVGGAETSGEDSSREEERAAAEGEKQEGHNDGDGNDEAEEEKSWFSRFKVEEDTWYRWGDVLLEFANTISSEFTIVVCHLVLMLVALLGYVNVMKICYLGFVFVCLILMEFKLRRLIMWCWPSIVGLAGAFLTACYVYQFEDVQNFFASLNVSEDVLRDFGLEDSPPPGLAAYLVQHVSVMVITGMQWKIFLSNEPVISFHELTKKYWATWATSLLEFLQRFVIIFGPKTALIILFFTAVNNVDIVNLIALVFLVVTTPFPRVQRWFRVVLLVYMQGIVVMELAFQLTSIQDQIDPEALEKLTYLGFRQMPPPGEERYSPSYYLIREIALVLTLSLTLISEEWRFAICQETGESTKMKNGIRTYKIYGEFLLLPPSGETDSKGASETSHSPGTETAAPGPSTRIAASDAAEAHGSDVIVEGESIADLLDVGASEDNLKLEWMKVEDAAGHAHTTDPNAYFKESGHAIWESIKYLISNFYSLWGFEISLLMHVVAGLIKLNAVGLFYLVMLGVWFALPKQTTARVWFVVPIVVSLLLLAQYLVLLGPPPNQDWNLPWTSWSDEVKQVLGLDRTISPRVLGADFFLYFFSVLQQNAFLTEAKLKKRMEKARSRSGGGDSTTNAQPLKTDFARNVGIAAYMKRYVMTYWAMLVILTSFNGGTSFVSVFGFVNVLFSLYFLSKGEDVLLDHTVRDVHWQIFRWYNYLLFLVTVTYQIPAVLLDIQNTPDSILVIVGLYKLYLHEEDAPPDESDVMTSFGLPRILFLIAFGAFLVQDAIISSSDFESLKEYLISDNEKASKRQQAYRRKKRQERIEKRQVYLQEYEARKLNYDVSKMDFFERWKSVPYQDLPESEKKRGRSTTVSGGTTGETSGKGERTLILSEQLVKQSDTALDDDWTKPEDADKIAEEEAARKGKGTKEQSKFSLYVERFIIFVYSLSAEYRDIEEIESDFSAKEEEISASTKLWMLLYGFYLCLVAHMDIVCFFFVYLNQIFNATILSTVLSIFAILFGITQRPFTPRTIWLTLIIYTQLVIVVKYFFQFPFQFNLLDCASEEFQYPWFVAVGIQQYCGDHFSPYILTELLVLFTALSYRSALIKFGLWFLHEDQLDSQIAHHEKSKEGALKSPEAEQEKDHARSAANQEKKKQKKTPWYEKIWLSVKSGLDSMLSPSDSDGTDYYVRQFLADAFVFTLTILFFNDFSSEPSTASIDYILEQNSVPAFFLVIAILEFCIMLGDRMVYTAKAKYSKLFLQYVTVFVYHVWIFFVLPPSKEMTFIDGGILPFWYFVKWIYWYYSACQIKEGYPAINVNIFFLTKKFGFVNRYLYQGYRLIPLVFEIRCVLDWTVSPSTLTIMQWIKIEDIYAYLFDIKCYREKQKKINRNVGDLQPALERYSVGCLIVTGMVLLIWFPLILLALPGSTLENPPIQVRFELEVNGYSSMYTQIAGLDRISQVTESEFDELQRKYPSAFSIYKAADRYQKISFAMSSLDEWTIPPPSKETLISELRNPNVSSALRWQLILTRTNAYNQVAYGEDYYFMSHSQSVALADIMNNTGSVAMNSLLPMFYHSLPSGALTNLDPDGGNSSLLDVNVIHQTISEEGTKDWFELEQVDPQPQDASSLEIYVLSDPVPTESLGSYGIIGLYVVVVYAIGSIIRVSISGSAAKIMTEELPTADRLLAMCRHVFIAREFSDFVMEEALYRELVEAYRDPSVLIELSKVKRD